MKSQTHIPTGVLRLLSIAVATLMGLASFSCGGDRQAIIDAAPAGQLQASQPASESAGWLSALPVDAVQPWEELDADGYVVPAGRGASAINLESEFIPGVERFNSSGDVTGNEEASRIASESGTTSQAMYRIPLGGGHPGVVSVDANLLSGRGYYVGLADYGSSRWQWHGPFTDNHVRISTALQGPYTSSLGSLFVSVLVSAGSAADVVGIGVNTEDAADSTAPPQPTGLQATPVTEGMLLSWDSVIAGDIAGYRIYHSERDFSSGTSVGVQHVDSLEGLTQHQLGLPVDARHYIRISAVDISGKESPLSEIVSAVPLDGQAPELAVSIDKPSGSLAEGITLSASGAQLYDIDVDGDGTYDITGDTSGTAQVGTSRLGIIRPRVRATGTEETAVAHGSVSLVISGNSRPVAVAISDVASGEAPLEVTFSGTDSMDFDGSIVGGGWDFDGDGTYDAWDDADIVHITSALHTYTTPGVYNAKLRVVDDQGAWDVDTVSISVAPTANLSPTADLQSDVTSGDAPLLVNFDASGSSDPDGSIVEYAWDWDGDGGYDTFSDTASIAHTFTSAGSPVVKLRVEDSQGARGTDTLAITVNVTGNAAPTADLSVDLEIASTTQVVTFDASLSTDSDGTIVDYAFDFNGDGSFDSSGPSPRASHSYAVQYGYDALVRVTDNAGAQATATVRVVVTHGPWTGFGHDTFRTRRSPYIGAQTNTLKWSYTTAGWVTSSPAIGADGTLYVGSSDNKLHAINPDGSLKWTYTTGASVFSSPAIGADGTVYVGSNDNKLHAINPDGSLKWSYTTGDIVLSSPAIGADGTLYAGSKDNKLYAINPDGSLKWSYSTGGDVISCPAIGADGTLYVGSFDNKLYAINQDGSLKWSYTTGSWLESSPAIGADGTLYVGSRDTKLYAINPDGSLKWAYTTTGFVSSCPAIGADGTLYVGSFDDKLYAINPDGSLKWTYTTGDWVNSSPAIGADGTLYVGSYDAKLYAIYPDGTEKWSYTTGSYMTSSPAIGADGTVYVGSIDNKLYAIGP